MAVTKIAHRPDLTKEQAMDIFRRHFAGKYEVVAYRRPAYALTLARWDFWVKKSGLIGLRVRLQQSASETKFVYAGWFPSSLAAFGWGFLIGYVFSYFLWNSLTGEVRSFIESAPEFK